MNLPVVVDISIGLVFIYLILSLIASEIQELIATFLQWRAKHLKHSIELLLAGGSETEKSEFEKAQELVQELYQDPLINTLNQQAKRKVKKLLRENAKNSDKKTKKALGNKDSAPSYLPSETFASSLVNALKIPQLITYVKHPSDEFNTNLHMILTSFKELKTGINDTNSESYKIIKQVYGDFDQKFIDFVNNDLPDYIPNNLITSLGIIGRRGRIKIDDLTEEMNQFKNEIETWFDRSMDRASGVYKRNAKGVAILIGISVAILTNTDTFFVLKRLSQDSAVRSAITQSAIQQQNDFLSNQNARTKFQELIGEASVPIGWQNISQQFQPLRNRQGNSANNLLLRIWLVFKIVFGWLVSGLAIAMGAPFWFDILNKIINVRNSGPRPVKYTQDQQPEEK